MKQVIINYTSKPQEDDESVEVLIVGIGTSGNDNVFEVRSALNFALDKLDGVIMSKMTDLELDTDVELELASELRMGDL